VPKPHPSKEFRNFTKLTDRVLAVPHADVQKRIAKHREQANQNRRKRGPKPKTSGRASAQDRAEVALRG